MMLRIGQEVQIGGHEGKVVGHAIVLGEEEINVIEIADFQGPRRFVLVRFLNGVLEVL